MKYFLIFTYEIVAIIITFGTIIKGIRTQYVFTTIVGVVCTILEVLILVWEVYEFFKKKGRHRK